MGGEPQEADINDQIRSRIAKLDRIRELGSDPWPVSYDRTDAIRDVLEKHADLLESQEEVSIAGRLVAKRVMGKASFAHVMDRHGRLQLYLARDDIEAEGYPLFKSADLGDWVGVRGRAFVTKTGEASLAVTSFTPLAKCLRPLPNLKEVEGQRFSAFSDVEARYRQRYLDLIVNPDVRQVFEARAEVIRGIRQFLDDRDFLEVETPSLQPLYGGANARPFVTHHNTLDSDFYLRISDELYLKRLIVGGFEKVYEIGHNFRNEGMDRSHNPEYTSMEFYTAFMDYLKGMDIVEELYRSVVRRVNGSLQVQWEDTVIDFEPPFRRARMADLLKDACGIDMATVDEAGLLEACRRHNIEVDPKSNWGQLVDALVSELVEPSLVQPTFIMDYPKAISPLARAHRNGDPHLVERFEIFIIGTEFGNAFSELNDPADQRARLEAQSALRDAGDDEANIVDEDFLTALEFGMPPTFGFGMGVDRLVMLVTNQSSIKDVILFPTLKPEV